MRRRLECRALNDGSSQEWNACAAAGHGPSLPPLRHSGRLPWPGPYWPRPTVVTGAARPLQGGNDGDSLGGALQAYLALPGTESYLIHIGPGGSLGRIAHRPDHFLFTASAYKTFVLGQYLRDVEVGLLAEDAQLDIDDSVRHVLQPRLLRTRRHDPGPLGAGCHDRL